MELDRNRKCRVGLALAATLFLCALASPDHVSAQAARQPLSKDAVVKLLEGDVSPKRVAVLARELASISS